MDKPCKLHVGQTNNGYGIIRLHGKQVRRHRHVYEQEHGKLPDGIVVRHLCHVRRCYELSHLAAGTQKDKMQDAVKADRMDRVLSADDVLRARQMYTGKRGEVTAIAKLFGIQRGAMSLILRNKRRNIGEHHAD